VIANIIRQLKDCSIRHISFISDNFQMGQKLCSCSETGRLQRGHTAHVQNLDGAACLESVIGDWHQIKVKLLSPGYGLLKEEGQQDFDGHGT